MGFDRVTGVALPAATHSAMQIGDDDAMWAAFRFLLQRFDPDAFHFANHAAPPRDASERGAIVAGLKSLDFGYLVKSSSDVRAGHSNAAQALEAMLAKVEMRHGAALFNRAFQNQQDARAAKLIKGSGATTRRKSERVPLATRDPNSTAVLVGDDLTHTVKLGDVTVSALALQTPLHAQSPRTRAQRNAIPTGATLQITPLGAAPAPPQPSKSQRRATNNVIPTGRQLPNSPVVGGGGGGGGGEVAVDRRKTNNMIPTGRQLAHSPADVTVVVAAPVVASPATVVRRNERRATNMIPTGRQLAHSPLVAADETAALADETVSQPTRTMTLNPERAARNAIPTGRQLANSPGGITSVLNTGPAWQAEETIELQQQQQQQQEVTRTVAFDATRALRNAIPTGRQLPMTPVVVVAAAAAAEPIVKRHPLAQSTPARDLPPSPEVAAAAPVNKKKGDPRNIIPTGRQLPTTPVVVVAAVEPAPVIVEVAKTPVAPVVAPPTPKSSPKRGADAAFEATPAKQARVATPKSAAAAVAAAPTPVSAMSRLRALVAARSEQLAAAAAAVVEESVDESSEEPAAAAVELLERANIVQANAELDAMEAIVDALDEQVLSPMPQFGGWSDVEEEEVEEEEEEVEVEEEEEVPSSPYVPPPAAERQGMTMADIEFVEEAQRQVVATQLDEAARQIEAAERRRLSLERHHAQAAEQLEAAETEHRKAANKLEQRVAALAVDGEPLPTDRNLLRAEVARLRAEQAEASRVPSTLEDVAQEVAAASAVEAARNVALNDRARRAGASVVDGIRKRRLETTDAGERALDQIRARQERALETIARANVAVARMEDERLQMLQSRPTEELPQQQHRVPPVVLQKMARGPAVRARETLKARVQMHNLRVMLLRQNAQMMVELTAH